MNLAGPLTKIPNTAHVMAQKIQKAKAPKAAGIPKSYRSYQTHKIKAPIHMRGKAPKVTLSKGLSNPYTETLNV